ncbi:single-stranded DNA-binding protein [Actinoplanes sp. URMC 104]|uniref:single-stranded DNA-binding protein n=1 Tax=Actinoplanes sp. URMC 104 TaxID=3423409 RepID=UPI003F1C720C
MFDTHLAVVGNVLVAPESRRFEDTGSVVANFKIASHARRFDRASNTWVDGNSLRVRVTAWRRLAEGVLSSISVGDPVIVYGRLYTRDWKDEDGNPRISYEMEAFAIGHDLARGRSQFVRRSAAAQSEDDVFAGGGASAPVSVGDGVPEDETPPFLEAAPAEPAPGDSPDDEEIAAEVERINAEQPAPARRTRRSRREPVAA